MRGTEAHAHSHSIIQFKDGKTCGKRIAEVVCSASRLLSWGTGWLILAPARGSYRIVGSWPMSVRVYNILHVRWRQCVAWNIVVHIVLLNLCICTWINACLSIPNGILLPITIRYSFGYLVMLLKTRSSIFPSRFQGTFQQNQKSARFREIHWISVGDIIYPLMAFFGEQHLSF